ncbi:AAA family ATPase [Conexibacter sp. S30A1]|uniref:AAA family ATPase n=1 Tax=Conexibacter sp. S30A1 TaxID=2937800 RepID=UPI00200E647B|nr:AAA family ATPase [Conexibacter sp. S30A1]
MSAASECYRCGGPLNEGETGTMHPQCADAWLAERKHGPSSAAPAPEVIQAPSADGLTSWAPVDLADVLAGDYVAPAPTMLAREDGRCLMYVGRSHWVSAEPEALKTWFALLACAEQLDAGRTVLYLDFEAGATEIVGRLRALGVEPGAIRQGFVYIRPDEPLAGGAVAALDAALAHKPVLSIVDGVTESFALQGLSPLDNSDAAAWLDLLPRRVLRAGSPSLALDHVVKDKEQRGRYAIGAQHKLAGVDVAYTLEVVEPFGRGHDGVATVKVQKDRPGGVREFAQDGVVATLRAASLDGGRVSLSLEPPEAHARGASFRPTHIMERICRALEEAPGGLSKRAIRAAAGAKAQYVDLALDLLITEGHVRVERSGTANLHVLVAPYDGDRVPVFQACSDRVPAEGNTLPGDRVPVFRSFRSEQTRDTEPASTLERERVPARDVKVCSCQDGGLGDGYRCERCLGWQVEL